MFTSFYGSYIRKYTIAFGNLFNDIVIERVDQKNNRIQTLAVPIAYGPKAKWLSAAQPNTSSIDRQDAIRLPRIGFELTSLTYDSTRKMMSTIKNRKVRTSDGDIVNVQFAPVPYDLIYTLSVIAKNVEDGARIIEQIVPYFTPDWTTKVNVVPELDLVYDIRVVLNSATPTDTYDASLEDRRIITWDLDFTVKGMFFGPVNTSGVIKRSSVNSLIFAGNLRTANNMQLVSTSKVEKTDVRPGLTANGTPTTILSESIPLNEIDSDDDFGFIETFTSFVE